MEEVRSYWQVASITHFCNLFGRPFKLPTFEPEELEQAFIIDVPEPPKNIATNNNQNNSNPNNHFKSYNNHNNIESSDRDVDNSITSKSPSDGENTNGEGNDRLASPDNENLKEEDHNNEERLDGEDGHLIKKQEVEEVKQEPEGREDDDDDDYDGNDDDDDDKDPRDRKRRCNDPSFKPPPSLLNYQPVQQPEPQPDEPEMHLLVKLGIALLKPHFNSKLTLNNWENYLNRLVDAYWVELEHHPSPFRVPIITPEGIELTKNLTFNELPLSDKIDLIYALCDYRFWCEDASDLIKDYTIDDLRLESIGKDSQGYEYWYFFGTRLFREDKELSQDLILRKKRMKELEYKLIELEKARILREQEEKRKVEIEKAKQLALEAKEARLNAKKRQNEAADNSGGGGSGSSRKRRNNTPTLPPRTGLRERRSSAASNNNDSQLTPRTTRSKVARQSTNDTTTTTEQLQPQSAQKTTRSSSKQNSKQTEQSKKAKTPEPPKKPPMEECKEELEKIAVKSEDRAAAWCIQCESLEEWESFAIKFEKTKSTNEKYLSNYVNQEIMPRIRNIYAKRAAEAKRKERELIYSMTSRRTSSRIISKRAQEEEEERLAKEREVELQKKKAESEERLRIELEQALREKRIRERAAAAEAMAAASAAAAEAASTIPIMTNGNHSTTCGDDGGLETENNGRYNLRQQQQPQHLNNVHQPQELNHQQYLDCYDSSHDFDGIIHPDKLSEFYEALELIIDTVKTSKHAWPFVDPVPDTVPGYYDLIEEPMDLRKLRTKVEFREYKSLIELEKDFQLLVNNCEKFNGPKNVYTKMVYKLWKSFRKNVILYLQRDLCMDEFETFLYPPPVPVVENAQQITAETTNSPTKDNTKNNTTPTNDTVVQNGIQKTHTPEDQGDTPTSNSTTHDVLKDVCHQNGIVENGGMVGNKVKHENHNIMVKQEEQANNTVVVETKEGLVLNNDQQTPIVGTKSITSMDNSRGQEVPMELITEEMIVEQPPEPVVEEVIIESIPCQDETYYIWPQDGNTVAQQHQ